MRKLPKNTSKYLSYKAAWERINAASAAGFSFEVVTLCESIISNRLLSFVLGVAGNPRITERTDFHQLIREWRKRANPHPKARNGDDLISKVDIWRKERNKVVHGMTKSLPGAPTEPVTTFVQRAQAAANEGIRLAKEVQVWHRDQVKSVPKR